MRRLRLKTVVAKVSIYKHHFFNGSCLASSLSLSLSSPPPPPVLFFLLFDSPKIVLKMNNDLSISDPYIRLP